MPTPAATKLKVTRPYLLDVTFEDGIRRLIDMEEYLQGEMFEPLRDYDLFSQAAIDTVWHTVVWPNGADLAPEFLYEERPAKARKRSVG
jgi:hypothetical protein